MLSGELALKNNHYYYTAVSHGTLLNIWKDVIYIYMFCNMTEYDVFSITLQQKHVS